MSTWPGGRAGLRRDVAVPKDTVDSWARRNSIPARHWKAVAEAAARRDLSEITVEFLADRAFHKWASAGDSSLEHSIHPGAG